MSKRHRVFFDTSAWVAAVLSDRGASFYLLDAAQKAFQSYDITSSLDVFEEGIETLEKKYPKHVDRFKEFYSHIKPTLTEPKRTTILSAASLVHPDDAPILAGVIESKSDILVTLDKKHLLDCADRIASQTGIIVLSPGTFLQKIRSSNGGLPR